VNEENQIIQLKDIQNRIYTIRGIPVMLDSDLAEIYGVKTKVFNQAVKRNFERFPESFRFQLTDKEFSNLKYQIDTLRSQIVTSNNRGGRRYFPYVFTEQGVAMLSTVLRSETAVKISIRVMQAFVEMKKFILTNAAIFQRLEKIEIKQIEADKKFEQLFSALENKSLKPKQGIFFNGQIYDAYIFVTDLIRTAKTSIILIDNYVDETVLTILSKRNNNVNTTIYTQKITKQLALDLRKHNKQYEPIEIKEFNHAHDRFLIIDDTDIYHFGASLKDLGKKWFAFSKMNIEVFEMLKRLKENNT